MENHELVKKVEQLDKKLKQMEQEHLDLPILSPLLTQLKKHYSLRLILSLGILTLALSAMVYATSLNKPFNFSDGQVASASQVNANFDKLYDHVSSHYHPGFPDGFGGDVVNAYINSGTPYNVGAGRTLYITSAINTDAAIEYISNGINKFFALAATGGNLGQGLPLVFQSGTAIQTINASGVYFTGIEVDTGVAIKNLQLDNSTGYFVPPGTILVILSLYHEGSNTATRMWIDGMDYVGCTTADAACIQNMSQPVIVNGGGSGVTIKCSASAPDYINITGYEVPN
ncbi:MAG: hypothetical protein ABIK68_04945 [bacterium]